MLAIVRNKLYSSLCILYNQRSENSVCCKLGYCDLKNLLYSIFLFMGMESIKTYFIQVLVSVTWQIKCSNSNRKIHIVSHNLKVKHNRDIIKRLLSFQNLAFRRHDESESS
jgi:hypothetical protein